MSFSYLQFERQIYGNYLATLRFFREKKEQPQFERKQIDISIAVVHRDGKTNVVLQLFVVVCLVDFLNVIRFFRSQSITFLLLSYSPGQSLPQTNRQTTK